MLQFGGGKVQSLPVKCRTVRFAGFRVFGFQFGFGFGLGVQDFGLQVPAITRSASSQSAPLTFSESLCTL